MTRLEGVSRSADRTSMLLGGAGCGCGMLLVAAALVVLTLATAFGSLPAAQVDPNRPDIIITVQEAFFQQMLARLQPGDSLRDVTIKVQPGGVVAAQGRIEASLFGQNLVAPFSLTMRLSAQDGRLRVEVTDVQVGGDQALSSAARTMLGGLDGQISQAVNDQIIAGLGSDAYIMDVTTDGPRLIIRARWASS